MLARGIRKRKTFLCAVISDLEEEEDREVTFLLHMRRNMSITSRTDLMVGYCGCLVPA